MIGTLKCPYPGLTTEITTDILTQIQTSIRQKVKSPTTDATSLFIL